MKRYALTTLLLSAALAQDTADPLRQAQRLTREGNLEEAATLYRQALEKAPDSFPANSGMGVLMDLMGRYTDARRYFSKALEIAPAPQNKAQALRSMAMSYAFENDCRNAEKYESRLYDTYLAAPDFYQAGEMADELARVCLESGDLDSAYNWYKKGYDAGLREPGIKPERKDLWEFRWEHAQARIAARRGNMPEAQKHVAAAKAILDKGTNPAQAPFFPYLTGYVAFYGGDYKAALADLQKANQNDPFILSLIARTYEKLGERAQAVEYYRKVMRFTTHNPPNAFARPLARKKLE